MGRVFSPAEAVVRASRPNLGQSKVCVGCGDVEVGRAARPNSGTSRLESSADEKGEPLLSSPSPLAGEGRGGGYRGGATAEALPASALYRLLTWTSPSFPVGAYSHSHGLEWAVEAGAVRDSASLQAWLDGVIRHGAGRSDAILFAASHRAVLAGDWTVLAETAELALALQPSAERRLEATAQGRAFLAAVEAVWPSPTLDRLKEAWPHEVAYPVAVGVATAAHGLPLAPALRAALHGVAANLVSAGVRLIPLGQTDGLRVLSGLEPAIEQAAREALAASLADIGGATLLADIASMRHETQYTRLFRT